MSTVSNFAPPCSGGGRSVSFSGTAADSKFRSNIALIPRPYQNDKFLVSCLALRQSSRATKDLTVRIAIVDERLARRGNVGKTSEILAYYLIQRALVRWSSIMDRSFPDPPTAVFLHGILGIWKNWGTFAWRLAKEFPTWQLWTRYCRTCNHTWGGSFGM